MISWPHNDKLLHFGLTSLIAAVLCAFGFPVVALLTSFFLAAAKEKYDQRNPESHTFDGWDAYWGHAGGTFAVCWHLFFLGGG